MTRDEADTVARKWMEELNRWETNPCIFWFVLPDDVLKLDRALKKAQPLLVCTDNV